MYISKEKHLDLFCSQPSIYKYSKRSKLDVKFEVKAKFQAGVWIFWLLNLKEHVVLKKVGLPKLVLKENSAAAVVGTVNAKTSEV